MILQTATPWRSIRATRVVAACACLFTVLAASIITPAFSAPQSCSEQTASWSTPSTRETVISAFDAEIEPGSRARFEGDVRVNGLDRVFSAGLAELDFERNALVLENRVVIQDETLCVEGQRAEGQLLSGEGLIQRAEFRQRSGLQGQVETLKLYSDGAISLTNGAVTFCPSPSPPWSLSIDSLTTNTEQSTLIARRSTLRLKGVPALYIPYIKVPTGQKRQSGFLPPDITNDSRDGATTELQYYFNLHPQRDATAGARVMSNRGTLWMGELRNKGLHHEERFYGEYIQRDENYKRAGLDEKRWLSAIHHLGTWSSVQTQINFRRASSAEHLRDFMSPLQLGGETLGLTRQANPLDTRLLAALPQYAGVRFSQSGFHAGIEVQRYQGLLSQVLDTFERQPNIYIGQEAQLGDWQFHTSAQWTEFRRETLEQEDEIVKRQRVQMNMERTWSPSWGYTTTNFGVTHHEYEEDLIDGSTHDISITRPEISFDLGLFFDNTSKTRGNATLTPRLLVAYSGKARDADFALDSASLEPGIGNLFDRAGYSGLDPIESGLRGSLGINWTRDLADGRQSIVVEVGQRFFDSHFTGDNPLNRRRSPIYLSTEWSPKAGLNTLVQLEWRPGDSSPLNQFFDMSFRWADRGSLSIQHISRERSLGDWTGRVDQQVTLSQIASRIPLGNQWSVIGMWSKNHTVDRQVESIAGLELDSCCTRFSIAYRQFSDPKLSLDPDSKTFFFKEQPRRGIFLEVELKGLTSFGNGISKVLSRSFPAF